MMSNGASALPRLRSEISSMVDHDRLIRNFVALGLIDGMYGNEAQIAAELMSRLRALDLTLRWILRAKHSVGMRKRAARLRGVSDVAPIFLCAHMDTIQSTKNLKHVFVTAQSHLTEQRSWGDNRRVLPLCSRS